MVTVDAVVLSSRVIPSESRRQGIVQVNPCPGDTVEFSCTLNDTSAAVVRWTADGIIPYSFVSFIDVGRTLTSIPGLTASFVNTTTLILLVNLKESAPNVVNGTEVSCAEISGVRLNATEVLKIIGMYHTKI